jgi:hypothetical protein
MKGGARPGAGRKSIAEEFKTSDLCRQAIITRFGSLEEGLIYLIKTGEPNLMKFVFEHAIGKPTEHLNVELPETVKSFVIERASTNKDK